MTCKNVGFYKEDGDIYCFLNFRGLTMEFAGINSGNGSGAIYITSLGKNQTVSSRGGRCMLVAFADKDLRGEIDAHILFRDDGVITHTINNKQAWEECR